MRESYTFAELEKWEESEVRLGVFGDPIAHSRSPQIMNAALAACGLPLQYARFQIASHELEPALRLLAARNFVGLNLTIPHKIAAARLVDDLEPFARSIGAINTVRVEEGARLRGFNTDGAGFSRAIRSEFSVDLRDLRVLLLGAGGGAGRAIAWQCALEGCERLILVNRTEEKAHELARELKPLMSDARVSAPVARLQSIPWDERALRQQIGHTDLVVNATPRGLQHGDESPLSAALLAPHLMVYDTGYTRARTPLMIAAGEAGARAANGLSMLLHQGALAFGIWFERDAPIEAMRAALQSQS